MTVAAKASLNDAVASVQASGIVIFAIDIRSVTRKRAGFPSALCNAPFILTVSSSRERDLSRRFVMTTRRTYAALVTGCMTCRNTSVHSSWFSVL